MSTMSIYNVYKVYNVYNVTYIYVCAIDHITDHIQSTTLETTRVGPRIHKVS